MESRGRRLRLGVEASLCLLLVLVQVAFTRERNSTFLTLPSLLVQMYQTMGVQIGRLCECSLAKLANERLHPGVDTLMSSES